MACKKKNFTPEFRDEASREVVDNSPSIASAARGIRVSRDHAGNGLVHTVTGTRVKSLRWNCPGGRGSARPSGKSGNYGRKSLSWKRVLRVGAAVSDKYTLIAADTPPR